MRASASAALIALLWAFLFCAGCSNHSNGASANSTELEFKVQSLQREIDELRSAQTDPPYTPSTNPSPTTAPASSEVIAKIRDEGFNRSQVMATLSYLTDVIGPRLTGSPQLQRANDWTRDKLSSWGLVNAHTEPWGFFGRGWSLKRFSAQIIEPQAIPLTILYEDDDLIVVPIPGEDNEEERERIRKSNDRDQELERQGKPSRHNRGYDEAADGVGPPVEIERVVDE